MRSLIFAAGLVVALTGFAAAQPFDTPEALLQSFYAPYLAQDAAFDDESEYFSADLQGLYEADAEATPEGEMGALGFDPFIDGQDWDITALEIGAAQTDGDAAVVVVQFDNFGETRALSYDLVREDGSWKIDDVASTTPGSEYRLSEILGRGE
jgi:hypothetical protein